MNNSDSTAALLLPGPQSVRRHPRFYLAQVQQPAYLLCALQFICLKDILMAGHARHTSLPTTVCEAVLYVTTVDITYNQGIASAIVADRRPFEN